MSYDNLVRAGWLPPKQAPFTPPSGSWQLPTNIVTVGAGAAATGVACFYPLDVGPYPLTIQSIGMNVTTADSGDGTTSCTIGLYPDNGYGGAPDCSAGPLAQGNPTVTATGAKSIAASLTLNPGRYWGASLYVITAAPTTPMSATCCSNVGMALWCSNGLFPTVIRYLSLAGQAALPSVQPGTFVGKADTLGPIVALRAA